MSHQQTGFTLVFLRLVMCWQSASSQSRHEVTYLHWIYWSQLMCSLLKQVDLKVWFQHDYPFQLTRKWKYYSVTWIVHQTLKLYQDCTYPISSFDFIVCYHVFLFFFQDLLLVILLKCGKKEPNSEARCIALCSLSIFLYEELVHATFHSRMKDALNVLLVSLKVSI